MNAGATDIAAIILAAGRSRRMGRTKALLPVDGKPMITRVVELARSADRVGAVIVVTGANRAVIADALAHHAVIFARNPVADSGGMVSSVQVGIRAAPPESKAVLIMLVDQPFVQPETVRALAAEWQRSRAAAIVPTCRGRRGHPILLSANLREEILALKSDQTLRDVVRRHEVVEVPVDDPGVLKDIDTPDDYAATLTGDDRRGTDTRESHDAE